VKKNVTLQMRNLALFIMDATASGSLDEKTKHGVNGSEGSLVFAFDFALKAKGKELLKNLGCDSLEEWIEINGAEGCEKLAAMLRKHTVTMQIVPEAIVPKEEWVGESFDMKDDVLEKLVKMQTRRRRELDAEEGEEVDEILEGEEVNEILLAMFFENGKSCSSGGYSDRLEVLLANEIPFFFHLFSELHDLFDIKQMWMRASEEGTHDKHFDKFSRGATHRGILSINCHGKKMHFER
jgi:hypothetical protein